MQQSIMALTAFWVLVFFMLDRILPASAYPISVSQIPQSSIISSGVQQQGSAPTPIPATLLPRDHETTGSEPTTTLTVDKEVTDGSQPSDTSASPTAQTTNDNDDDENSSSQHGLNPNVIAGIAVGVAFGVLLVIAALMYAFRVGWEKGQKQKEKAAQKAPSQPPASPALEPWNQMDDIKPPEITLETRNSCFDSGSWTCCDEHMEKYKSLGERYSFRPGKGVYEIQEKDLELTGEDIREVWSQDESSDSRTDSGLGLGEEGKGKGHERL